MRYLLIIILFFWSLLGKAQTFVVSDTCSSWAACNLYSSDYDTFLIKPGNYNSLGKIQPTISGAQLQPRLVQYANWDTIIKYRHPCNFPDSSYSVIIDGFDLDQDSFWIFRGLTIEGDENTEDGSDYGTANFLQNGSDYNVIDYCVIDSIYSDSGIRIRGVSQYNVISNCAFLGSRLGPTDIIGITIQSPDSTVSWGNVVYNNEIRNFSDGIQLSYTFGAPLKMGGLPGTTIIGNEIYLTEHVDSLDKGIYSIGENAIDIKAGSVSNGSVAGQISDASKIIVAGNLFRNFTPSCFQCRATGGGGEAVVIQNNSKNIEVKHNLIANSNVGVSITRSTQGTDSVKYVDVHHNVFFNIRQYTSGISTQTSNHGVPFVLTHDHGPSIHIFDNVLYQCTGIAYVKNQGGNSSFSGNELVESTDFPSSVYQGNLVDHNQFRKDKILKGNYSKSGSWVNVLFQSKILIQKWTNPRLVSWQELKALEPQ